MIQALVLLEQLNAVGTPPDALERHIDLLQLIADNAPREADVAGSSGKDFGLIWREGKRNVHFTFSRLSGDARFDADTDDPDKNPNDFMTGRITPAVVIACFTWLFREQLEEAARIRVEQDEIKAAAQLKKDRAEGNCEICHQPSDNGLAHLSCIPMPMPGAMQPTAEASDPTAFTFPPMVEGQTGWDLITPNRTDEQA